MSADVTRRDVIKLAGAAAAGILAGRVAAATPAPTGHPAREPQPVRKRLLRVAHLTDVHVQPERRAGQGMIAALHHVQAAGEKPDLILAGGDCVMDSFEADDVRTQLQWDLWHSVLKNECSLPIRAAIGNHDIWGANRQRSRTTGQEPNWGKKRAIDMLGLPERYYSFDQAGWHFIVLDSTQPEEEGYKAYIDPQQWEWLVAELKAAGPRTPIVVLSHIPIISAAAVLWAKRDEQQNFNISGSLVHTDGVKLKDLFAAHPNVKLCLSGHLHLVDRVDYNGMTYLCNGAVSGNWWKGKHKECGEGYAVIDFYDDGSFEHEYVTYGWKAE